MGISSAEEHFASLSYGGTHQETAELIAQGRGDIGVIGCNAYFDYIRDNPGKLHFLWMSPQIPLGPVLINKRLAAEKRLRISGLFWELHNTHPEIFSAIKMAGQRQQTHFHL